MLGSDLMMTQFFSSTVHGGNPARDALARLFELHFELSPGMLMEIRRAGNTAVYVEYY